MKAFKRILVPIDHSDHTPRILEYAFLFGKKLDLEIFVLHVVDSRVLQPMPYSYRQLDPEYHIRHTKEDMAIEIKNEVQKEIDEGIRFEHTLNVNIVVREGIPYDQIIKVSHEKSVDFIVMGTRGHTGLEEMFLGGVASKVSRRADCPVFLVRTRNTIKD